MKTFNKFKNYIIGKSSSPFYLFILSRFSKSYCKIIKNYFNKSNSRSVLICYIIGPFIKGPMNFHSNQAEALAIAKVFDQLNYNVDIVDHLYIHDAEYTKYNIIFGIGDCFEKSFYNDFEGIRILYATGAHPFYQIDAEMKRIEEFNKLHGTKLLPKRIPRELWPLSMYNSDYMVTVGNNWTKSTYLKYFHGPIYCMNVSNYFKFNISLERKIEREYVWIGSLGSIHKGLDLVIEAFMMIEPVRKINIIGLIDDDVMQYYSDKIDNRFKFFGFMDISKDSFLDVMEKSCYIINPSCSEGQSSSLILGMGYGCIPISSRESGVDISDVGTHLNELSSLEIVAKIHEMEQIYSDDLELLKASNSVMKKTRDEHSIEQYEKSFYRIIESMVNYK